MSGAIRSYSVRFPLESNQCDDSERREQSREDSQFQAYQFYGKRCETPAFCLVLPQLGGAFESQLFEWLEAFRQDF